MRLVEIGRRDTPRDDRDRPPGAVGAGDDQAGAGPVGDEEAGAAGAGPIIDPRMAQRRIDVLRDSLRRRTRIAAGVVGVATLVAAALGLAHSPLLGIHHVTVTGVDVAEPTIVADAGLVAGEPLIDVSESGAAHRLEAVPWVATARVVRSWPSSLHIDVVRRVAVAQVPTGASVDGPVAEVDVTGRVLARRHSPVAGLPTLVGVGRPGPAGSWLRASPGRHADGVPGAALDGLVADPGSATGAALAWAADLARTEARIGPNRDGVAVTRFTVGPGGTIRALVRPGAVTLDLGGTTELAARVAAVAAFLRAVPLTGLRQVDFSVPDRPTATVRAASG